MESQAWIELALENLKCSQKQLAFRLAVSPTQISKWKKDEYMSREMEDKFRELTGIGSRSPEFVVWAKSLDSAVKWERLISELAEFASETADTGYITRPLQEESDLLCWKTFYVLREMGVKIPNEFPSDLNPFVEDETEDDFDVVMKNSHADLILRIYKSLNNVYGFFAAYIQELTDDDELDIFETGMEIESCLMSLAACKLNVDIDFAPNFLAFKRKAIKDFEKWLGIVKNAAFRSGSPLRAELLDLVHKDHEALGFDAEAESLGFNSRQLHPDIYMNELLCGMRAIHQVLPAIVKKLGITEEELNIDSSEFRL